MWWLPLACARPTPTPAPAPAGPPRIEVHGAAIDVVLPADLGEPQRSDVLAWVRDSADSVGRWYGGFPAPALRLDVSLVDGAGVGFATTWPGRPPHVDLPIGRRVDPDALARDWILVHELTHLAFPPVADRHHWVEEGLATYLEPWERVAAGRLAPELAWHDFVRDLPQGLGPVGLDHDGSWAATYWGGALWCLLADLRAREATGNQRGLRDAVVAIARETGGMGPGGVHDLGEVLAIGDRAVGAPALTDTWRALADRRDPVDLDAIWKDLGVALAGDTVRFDDAAPDAAIRRAIAPPP